MGAMAADGGATADMLQYLGLGIGAGMGLGVSFDAQAAAVAGLRGTCAYPPAARERRATWATRFLPEHLYEYYAQRAALQTLSLPPGHARLLELPSEYVSMWPLDAHVHERVHVTGSFGYVTSLFKAVSTKDGVAYAVRRVEGVRAAPALLRTVVESWQRATHPCIVPLRRVTAIGSGATPALLFEHDYLVGARSVKELYLSKGSGETPAIPEEKMWSIVSQLLLAVRAAHDAGLTFRGLAAQRVLIHGHFRIAISSAGVLDVCESDNPKPLSEWQPADILTLGQLLLQLATRNGNATVHSHGSSISSMLEVVKSTYSSSLHALIVLLLSKPVPVHELVRLLAPQLASALDAAASHADLLDTVLAREMDNGRIMRLLFKLNFICERAEHDGNPQWAETGDRYPLKLFRDFVFHQTGDDGRPVLDMAHTLEALTLLDAGSSERILLSSRDGATLLVASYAQLKQALEAAYDDLKAASSRGAAVEHASGARSGTRHARVRGRGRGRGGFAFTQHSQSSMFSIPVPYMMPTAPEGTVGHMDAYGDASAVAYADAYATGDASAGADGESYVYGADAWGGAAPDGAYDGGGAYTETTGQEEQGVYGEQEGMYGVVSDFQHMGAPEYLPLDAAAHSSMPADAAITVEAEDPSAAASLNVAAPEFRPAWMT